MSIPPSTVQLLGTYAAQGAEHVARVNVGRPAVRDQALRFLSDLAGEGDIRDIRSLLIYAGAGLQLETNEPVVIPEPFSVGPLQIDAALEAINRFLISQGIKGGFGLADHLVARLRRGLETQTRWDVDIVIHASFGRIGTLDFRSWAGKDPVIAVYDHDGRQLPVLSSMLNVAVRRAVGDPRYPEE